MKWYSGLLEKGPIAHLSPKCGSLREAGVGHWHFLATPGCYHSECSRWAMAPSWTPAWERGSCWGEPLATCCRTKAAQHLLLVLYPTTRIGACSQPSPPSPSGCCSLCHHFQVGAEANCPKQLLVGDKGSEVSSRQAAE